MTEISYILKTMMKDRKMTMQDLANMSGVTFSSIKSIRQGRSKNPRGHTLQAICNVFGCEVSELISGEVLTKNEVDQISSTPDKAKVDLFKESIAVFDDVVTQNNYEISEDLRDKCINQLFEFALESYDEASHQPKIDRTFAKFLIKSNKS